MQQEIENKLRLLREKYTGSQDSQDVLDGVEKEFRQIIEEKRMVENPVFIMIMKDAECRLNEINTLLMNDETLSDLDRKILFKDKRRWTFIFERFGMKPHDDALKLLTVTLDQKMSQ